MSLLDIDKVLEESKDLPLCSFFLETRKNAKRKCVLSWLNVCDDDTLKLINQYFDKTLTDGELADSFETNTKPDIFDEAPEDEVYKDSFEKDDEDERETEKKTPITDETDLVFLTILLLAWENNLKWVDEDVIDEAINQLVLYSSIEIMIRLGLLKYNGKGGKFFDDTAKFTPVKGAKKKAKALAKKKKP